MTGQERYHLVTPLPPLGGWRRMLAIDRRGSQSGPVVLSFAPMELLEDAARLAAISRDAEVGARVHHPHVLPVLGLETVDDQLALAEPYRAGTALRVLLDASGRLPLELALRVACDVAEGLAALHALDAGDGQPLAHGALTADRILVAEDGASLVSGVGTGGGRSAADDVRALAAVVAEMLTGDAPRAGAPLDAPGVPPAVAAVIERARGIAGEPLAGAAAFGAALAGAFAPAPAAAVAVYVGSATPPPGVVPPPPAAAPSPPPMPEPPEVSAELIAPGKLGDAARGSEPPADRTPPPDAAITFPAPTPPVPPRRLRRAPVLLALAVVGFTAGFGVVRAALGRRAGPPSPAGEAAPPPALPAAADARPAPAEPSPAADARSATEVKPAGEAAKPAIEARTAPPAAPEPRKPCSVAVSAVPAGEILVDGRLAGRAPVLVEVAAGEHEVRLRDRAQGVDVRKRVSVKAPATPVRFALARGKLEVTAPADTEIFVDGRHVGKGDLSVDLWEGWHEVEARRGAARVKERFELTALVTRYTYNVTPTE